MKHISSSARSKAPRCELLQMASALLIELDKQGAGIGLALSSLILPNIGQHMNSQAWTEVRIYLAEQGFSMAGATAFAFAKGCNYDEASLLYDAMQSEMTIAYANEPAEELETDVLDTGDEELSNVPDLAIEAILELSRHTKCKSTLDKLDRAIGILQK